MQTKLHRWATEATDRRFGDLYNLVYDRAFLTAAWERVAANKGARTAGVDRVTVTRIETGIGVTAFLEQLRNALKSGDYIPVEARQVMIPKGNNSGKFRRLGIPTVADRVVQASLKAVLEPIFEADFKPCSYGFRPNRCAQDAISEVQYLASDPRKYQWVFETDIQACFDEISHTALMHRLRARVKDKRICGLVKAFLKSGVLTELGDREETLSGTPQGGILSPLLANIALSVLDDHFDQQWRKEMGSGYQRAKRKRNGYGNWKLIRYADDLVLMVSGDRRHAEALREEVSTVLAPLGLRLAPEKTRTVHVDEGFTFLGFDIRRMRKRGTSKYYVYTKPSKKAIQAIKDKVKIKTCRSTLNQDLGELLRSLNQTLAGWANYFRHGVSKAVFSAVDSHTWGRLMRWIRAKYKGKTRFGMTELRRRFCDRGWRFAHNGIVFTGASSVAVTRYRYRGSTIPTPWTPKPAATAVSG
jgi:RNA-directed DNA polymerase